MSNRRNGCSSGGQGRRPEGDPPRRNPDLNNDQARHYNHNNFTPEDEEIYSQANNFVPEDQELYPQPHQHGYGFSEDDAWMSEIHFPSLQDQELNDNVVNGLIDEANSFDFLENHEVEPPQEMEIANQEQQPLLESFPAKDLEGLDRLEIYLGDASNMVEAIMGISMVDAVGDTVREATGKVMQAVLEPVAVATHKFAWDVVQDDQRDFKTYTNVLRLIFDVVQNMVPGGATGRQVKDAIKQWLSAAEVRNVAG